MILEEFVEHRLALEQVMSQLGTSLNLEELGLSQGLTEEQAEAHLREFGLNQLQPRKGLPVWARFLKQFIGFFPILLESAGVLALIGWSVEGALDAPNQDNLYLGIILFLEVIATAIFSFAQEEKANKAASGFADMAPPMATVIRGGQKRRIPASHLAVGDLVKFKQGDKVPADLLVLEARALRVDNSSITGESEPQPRSPHCTSELFLETENLVFYTTNVHMGSGLGVALRTGHRTYIGHIADLVASTKPEATPLRREITRFLKLVTVVSVIIGLAFLGLGFGLHLHWVKQPSALIIARVCGAGCQRHRGPGARELDASTGGCAHANGQTTQGQKRTRFGNPMVLTLAAKSLMAVETLGTCSTICTDKTGTLTQNIMTVVNLWYDLKVLPTLQLDSRTLPTVVMVASLCSNASFEGSPENMAKPIQQRHAVGDATEAALLKFCSQIHDVEEFRLQHPKIIEQPFNSTNKFQFSIHAFDEQKQVLVFKGAPSIVLARCTRILVKAEEVRLKRKHKKRYTAAEEQLASQGHRLIALAYRNLPHDCYPADTVWSLEAETYNCPDNELTFVALAALQDPPKQGVAEAVAQCANSSIRVIMVTGDHALTATAIAREVGIVRGPTLNDVAAAEGLTSWQELEPDAAEAVVVTGYELQTLSEEAWATVLDKKQIVFARTSPEQKLEIVERCQTLGEIVAVTGDGVNDSPALKRADIGCAMGIMGSDVSKESAVVILMDDNFASIVTGIAQGRLIFENLRKALRYMVSSNSCQLLPFIFFAAFQLPLALSPLLILAINVGTDVLPSISLAYEKPEGDLMNRPPRNHNQAHLVTWRLAMYSYGYLGLWQAVPGFLAYFSVFWNAGLGVNDIAWTALSFWRLPPNEEELDEESYVFPFCVPPTAEQACRDHFLDLCTYWDSTQLFNITLPDGAVLDTPQADQLAYYGTTECWGFGSVLGEVYPQRELLRSSQTSFFLAVVITRMMLLVVCKTNKASLWTHGLRNWALDAGAATAFAFALCLIYIPGIRQAFALADPAWQTWVIGIATALLLLGSEELRKWVLRKKENCR